MIAALKSITGIGNENPPPIENKPEEIPAYSTENVSNPVKLVGEGSYSCIFRPGIECSRKQLVSKKYITKIQKYKETSKHEVEIGNLIKKIPHYSRYFAPIIESCDVTVDMLNNDAEAKKCDFIDVSSRYRAKTYESNRIAYVGKNTLADSLLQGAKNVRQLENYFRKWINTHILVLNGVSKLNAVNILHMDMKENNVMCKDKSGRPVIIDFGLSVNSTNIASPDFRAATAFFSYGANYQPWCLDIAMITYMIHKTKNADVEQPDLNAWRTEPATMDAAKTVIKDFTTTNLEMGKLLSADEIAEFTQNAETYYTPLFEGGMLNSPSLGDVYDELVKYSQSWDNYSTSIMFLSLLKQFGLREHAEEFPFMKQYISVLKTVILSMPDKRPTATDTCNELKKTASKITRNEKIELGKLLTIEFKPTGYKKISNEVVNSKIESAKVDTANITTKQRMMHHMKERHKPIRDQ